MDGDFSTGDNVILIVGGMGPMAGIECFKYVLSNCVTNGTDQDNLNTILISFPKYIANRVDYVVGKTENNPGVSVVHFLEPQLQELTKSFKNVIIGVPCITFHCPSIYSVFRKNLEVFGPNITLVSIISSTVEFIRSYYPSIRRIGIMSTDGTRHAKPFEVEMEEHGIEIVYLNDEQQDIVTDCIYNTKWGIKSFSFQQQYVHDLFCGVMDDLIEQKCEAIILGCTEIPLAIQEKDYKGIHIINPSWIMARNLVKEARPSSLKQFVI